MASIHDIYPDKGSDHLKADDLRKPDGSFQVVQKVISGNEVVTFPGREGKPDETKIVLSFEGSDKSVVVNKTNASILGSRYGADFNAWTGKPVIITASMKAFGGKTVPGIDLTTPLVPENVQAEEYAAGAGPVDDDVPFN
jgi:hypothetical protein